MATVDHWYFHPVRSLENHLSRPNARDQLEPPAESVWTNIKPGMPMIHATGAHLFFGSAEWHGRVTSTECLQMLSDCLQKFACFPISIWMTRHDLSSHTDTTSLYLLCFALALPNPQYLSAYFNNREVHASPTSPLLRCHLASPYSLLLNVIPQNPNTQIRSRSCAGAVDLKLLRPTACCR